MPLLYDPLYIVLTLVGLGLTLWAQGLVKIRFSRYSRIGVRSGMSGAEAAAAVCRAGRVPDVRIERHGGFLSDHYDPRTRTLRLSPDVYDGRSISAVAVAAHEAGHSIQHAVGYAPLGFRSAMVPVTNIGARLWMLPFVLGMFLANAPAGSALMKLGVLLFAIVVLFQLVTLPVEINASRRAKAVLAQTGIVGTSEEARGVEQVLDAAALTYVAAAAAAVLQLISLVLRTTRRD
ncbi:MAG: zinc metallopeptidase [Planctomycetota bacterium]